VDSKRRITAREGVSFLQVNDSEAQAEIFYGLFLRSGKIWCKMAECREKQSGLRLKQLF
jgi:hypothetical protein